MSNTRPRRGKGDRGFATRDPYEVAFFARKHGIATVDAKRIINTHGSDRDSCDKAANRLK
ncbi:hypothetical protein RGCCGE502_30413 (plasmid) [Rhizobium grahamii CCGE 502]|uniref:DUF3606 domain-containing protein n=1 Tax=Rhizobium grahamii CCGE 502 TaxID=990285 RepID=S3I5X1_9HYPH|nr:hypothetical protein [Rhizobium grahamii]EPE94903.1 hypothetical protein RGCCGE502_30413 [Rhizobium grahamii CCGE 502]